MIEFNKKQPKMIKRKTMMLKKKIMEQYENYTKKSKKTLI